MTERRVFLLQMRPRRLRDIPRDFYLAHIWWPIWRRRNGYPK